MTPERLRFAQKMSGGTARLVILVATMLASSASANYSAAWDFSNANSKLDAMAQAQASALSLFRPDQAFTGVKAKQASCMGRNGKCYYGGHGMDDGSLPSVPDGLPFLVPGCPCQ